MWLREERGCRLQRWGISNMKFNWTEVGRISLENGIEIAKEDAVHGVTKSIWLHKDEAGFVTDHESIRYYVDSNPGVKFKTEEQLIEALKTN